MTTDDESVRALVKIVARLASADTGERFEATDALGSLGASAAAVDALVVALRDPQLLVRLGAIKALGLIGSSATAAAGPALLAAMDQPEQTMQAAWALGKLGANAPAVLARLRGLLDDDDEEAREVAAMALWRIVRDPDAVHRIGDALDSGDPMLVAIAARDLIEIGGHRAAARLEVVLTTGDEGRAGIVSATLARVAPNPEAALRYLRDRSRQA